ncbi:MULTISPECIES: 3'-5' exonuclease [Rhizobium/Agrobacterium group]|uniref:DNA 3'-5' helicase n=1 Tax=Agrobacterium tomkonis CFBP 6623 TaxID=1183432 RepID=A0A1S7Q017_9HYPH|nr:MULTISPECIES: 3'-5' exonuclease [Rhizobium/Agrobacterium group]QCL88109.1 DNA helicase [Agrobacterium tumefaciens]CUX29235.1 UvrD/REP helicase [Agrobacterium tomkonis CFBP 6623]
MPTILADSFTTSLTKLTNDEQKQVKLTAFDLQTDPNRPGLQFHRIDASKDPNFWSVRVNRDLRIIIHKTGDSVMLAYVDHHDDAYKWAERRRIETHPRTGALQIVEVRERVEEIVIQPAPARQPELPFLVQSTPSASALPLFSKLSTDDALSIGVPEDWIKDVLGASEDKFFTLANHLPQEAAEALLEYAATGVLSKPTPPATSDPYSHPDAQRRFRILEGHEELAAALDQPFEKWAVFLHPSQKALVDRDFSGPVRVVGSAGTGKTVVALHRVARILRNEPQAKVLLTTFSEPLAAALKRKLGVLLADTPSLADRVTISSFEQAAADLFALMTGRKAYLIGREKLRALITDAANAGSTTKYTPQFLNSEWEHVIDAWQIDSAETYATVPRMGRKNRLGAKQRDELWTVFAEVRRQLRAKALLTAADLFTVVTDHFRDRADRPYTHVVVDEAQDLGVAELRFLNAIVPNRPDSFFFAGDIGQRIFQQPFSWKGLGIEVRGRSFTLKVNYRTSHQIRRMADRLLPESVRDVDGEEDQRKGTVSVFDGVEPVIVVAPTMDEEATAAAQFLRNLLEQGIRANEIGIFCRSNDQIARASKVAELAAVETVSSLVRRGTEEAVLIGTMHLAKGLEFRAVLIVACDEGVLPLATRIDEVADEFELDEVVATERQLLYVAATRARDHLFVSAVTPGSEFLEDLLHV